MLFIQEPGACGDPLRLPETGLVPQTKEQP